MSDKRVMFSVNDYDYEGDIIDKGIYLHFGDTRIRVADDVAGFEKFVEGLQTMSAEIKENWLSI